MQSTRMPAMNGNEDNSSITLEEFVETLPKVELHAHLNGCIRESTLFELAAERNVTLSNHHFCQSDTFSYSPGSMYNIRPRSLQDCFNMFAEIPKCVNDLVSLRRITSEALDDFAFHHVAYLELRSTPKRLLRDYQQTNETEICTKKEYVEAIVSVMKEFERLEQTRFKQEKINDANPRLPLVPRFIVSVDRSASINDALEHVQLAIDMYQSDNEYVVGVDLGGNPTKNDFQDYEPAFRLARNAGLKVTIHCGEVPCGESAKDENEKLARAYQEAEAVLRFRPDRLGHALLLPDSLQSTLDGSHIAIETCPTSNVMTLELATSFHGNLIEGLKCHPRLGHWLQSEYPISVSTDDSGVFHTDPTKELLLLAIAYNLNEATLKKIVLQSMDHAFCDDKTRERLKEAMSAKVAS